MSFVDLPLPSRAVAIAERPIAPPAGFLFTVVMLTALFGFFAWWQGPGLWRDLQINQNPQHLPNGQVLDGECSKRRGLTDCDAHLVYDYNGQTFETDVSLAFFDLSGGDYEVDVVISRDNPELATISLGLDMLWNRLAVFTVFMLLFGGGAIGMVLGGLRAWNANRAARTPRLLELVPVEITNISHKGGATFATYHDFLRGKRSRQMTLTRFARGQEPLMAVDDQGKVMGVAVKPEHVGVPVLLDSGLERIELTAQEREEALAAFYVQQAGRGSAALPAEKAAPSLGKRLLRGSLAFVAVLLVFAVGLVGYWFYYVTSAGDAFDSVGMEINNIMPAPANLWGCQQLEARFGGERAPYGCTADDYTSWKTAPATKTKS